MKHSFVICAYKESPFLEECIQSLEKQTVKSTIKMVTSTPNEYIADMAKKHNIELIVNEGQGGIVQDWNLATIRQEHHMLQLHIRMMYIFQSIQKLY